jgi:hypothetical protein
MKRRGWLDQEWHGIDRFSWAGFAYCFLLLVLFAAFACVRKGPMANADKGPARFVVERSERALAGGMPQFYVLVVRDTATGKRYLLVDGRGTAIMPMEIDGPVTFPEVSR